MRMLGSPQIMPFRSQHGTGETNSTSPYAPPQPLELLANLVVHMTVFGMEAAKLVGVAMDLGEREFRFIQRSHNVQDVQSPTFRLVTQLPKRSKASVLPANVVRIDRSRVNHSSKFLRQQKAQDEDKGRETRGCHSEADLWPRNLALSGAFRTSGRDSSPRSE